MNVNGSTYTPGVITTKMDGKALVPGKIYTAGNTNLEPGENSTGSKVQTTGIKKATGFPDASSGFIKTGVKQQASMIMSQQEGNKLKDDDKDHSKLPMSDMHKDKDGKGPVYTEKETQADKPEVKTEHKESSGGVIPPPASQAALSDTQKATAAAFGMSDEQARIALADVDDTAKDAAAEQWAANIRRTQGTPELKAQQQKADFAQSQEPRITHTNAPTVQNTATGVVSAAPAPASSSGMSGMSGSSDEGHNALEACDVVKGMSDVERKTARSLGMSDCTAMKDSGKCPESGCVHKVSGNWKVMSNSTGKDWPANYTSESKADAGLAAFHANK